MVKKSIFLAVKDGKNKITIHRIISRLFTHSFIWYLCLGLITVSTILSVWYNYDYTFDRVSLQIIYQAKNAPDTAFLWLLHFFAYDSDNGVLIFLSMTHTLIVLFFIRIGEKIGIGRHTLLLLFILFNFSPEYNGVRLEVTPYLIFIIFWLMAVWWFLSWHEKSLTISFIGWAILIWFAALFSLSAILWALGLPLCFLFWPRHHYKKSFLGFSDREKIIVIYYLIVMLLVIIVPYWRKGAVDFYQVAYTQVYESASKMAVFLSSSHAGLEIDIGSALLIALMLVSVNALKIAGVLIVFFLWLSMRVKTNSVLHGRTRLFFIYNLVYGLLIAALSVLYQNRLQSDLYYLPIICLFLWLSSNGAYHIVQRLQSRSIRAEHQIVILWIMIAYALVSILRFGPSPIYEREAGEYASSLQPAKIYSNSPTVLYYAGKSPLDNHLSLNNLTTAKHILNANDLFIFTLNRRLEPPQELSNYQHLAQFKNRHGDTAYVLKSQP